MRNGDAPLLLFKRAHKRLAAPDYVTLNKVEIGEKNLANCGDSPNSPKFFLR